jgi:hypothetical protein
MCNWIISTNGMEIAHNEASDTEIEKATRCLDGQILLSVTVAPKDAKTVFEFDLGGELATWPYSDDEVRHDEQWILYDYEAKVTYALNGDGSYVHERI